MDHKIKLLGTSSCLLCHNKTIPDAWHNAVALGKKDDTELQIMLNSYEVFCSHNEYMIHKQHIRLIGPGEDERCANLDRAKEINAADDAILDTETEKDVIDANIKKLRVRIRELEMDGYTRDPDYIRDIQELRYWVELREKKAGKLKDKLEIDFADHLLEVLNSLDKSVAPLDNKCATKADKASSVKEREEGD